MNDTCGNCMFFDKEWNECKIYFMHVDSDEERNCLDYKDVKE